jgi:peptidoglycan/xylan/chitin deacetylase (PgdA/CDA1 family)
MNNSGGVTLYVHIMINFYVGVIKKYPEKVLSLLLAVFVAYIIILNGKSSITNSMESNNIHAIQAIKERSYTCKPVVQNVSDNKVILRLDDVQAFAYSDVTKKIIEDSVKRNMKMVLGVIPYNFSEDKLIDRELERNKCNLELALHGWNHSEYQETGEYEFENADQAEASDKIKEGKKILEKIGGEPVDTFIPPGNMISDDTKMILEKEGIKYLSGDNESSAYGMDATTYDFPNGKLIDNSEILKRCEDRFSQDEFCVIVIHPQDYLTDEKIDEDKYGNFISLLEELQNRKIQAVTFRDLKFPN